MVGREEDGLVLVQSSLPAIACRVIWSAPFLFDPPARKAVGIALSFLSAAAGPDGPTGHSFAMNAQRCGRIIASGGCPAGCKLNPVVNPARWPKAY